VASDWSIRSRPFISFQEAVDNRASFGVSTGGARRLGKADRVPICEAFEKCPRPRECWKMFETEYLVPNCRKYPPFNAEITDLSPSPSSIDSSEAIRLVLLASKFHICSPSRNNFGERGNCGFVSCITAERQF
jgi:hypothetical protein